TTTTVSRFVFNRPPTANAGGPYRGVAGTPIALNGTTSQDPDADPLTYAWDFGDGASGTGATPSHTYAAASTYTVRLTVSDGHFSTGPAAVQVLVAAANRPPTANAGGPYAGATGTPIVFDASDSRDPDNDTPLTYAWDFGDGTT